MTILEKWQQFKCFVIFHFIMVQIKNGLKIQTGNWHALQTRSPILDDTSVLFFKLICKVMGDIVAFSYKHVIKLPSHLPSHSAPPSPSLIPPGPKWPRFGSPFVFCHTPLFPGLSECSVPCLGAFSGSMPYHVLKPTSHIWEKVSGVCLCFWLICLIQPPPAQPFLCKGLHSVSLEAWQTPLCLPTAFSLPIHLLVDVWSQALNCFVPGVFPRIPHEQL